MLIPVGSYLPREISNTYTEYSKRKITEIPEMRNPKANRNMTRRYNFRLNFLFSPTDSQCFGSNLIRLWMLFLSLMRGLGRLYNNICKSKN